MRSHAERGNEVPTYRPSPRLPRQRRPDLGRERRVCLAFSGGQLPAARREPRSRRKTPRRDGDCCRAGFDEHVAYSLTISHERAIHQRDPPGVHVTPAGGRQPGQHGRRNSRDELRPPRVPQVVTESSASNSAKCRSSRSRRGNSAVAKAIRSADAQRLVRSQTIHSTCPLWVRLMTARPPRPPLLR